MHRILAFFLLSSFALISRAEDIISMKNGDIIKSVVSEISQTEVKYKKSSNINGPTYIANKSDVLSILFENGDKEVFANSSTQSQPADPSAPLFIKPVAAPDNEEIRTKYAAVKISHKKKQPNQKKLKTTKWATPVYGFTSESILSDSIINISFEISEASYACHFEYGFGDEETINSDYYVPRYKIVIKNKTQNMIYIDVANCFRISTEGEAESFLNSISVTKTSNNSVGAGMNLGAITNAAGIGGVVGTLANGIGIGGGKQNAISISENEEQIISIPPLSHKSLPAKVYINPKKTKSVKNYEYPYAELPADYPKMVETWAFNPVEYPDDNAVVGDAFMITYSTEPDFRKYTSLYFKLKMCGLLGCSQFTPYKDLKFESFIGLVGCPKNLNK